MNTTQLKVIPNTTGWQHELSLVMMKVVLILLVVVITVSVPVVVLEVVLVVAIVVTAVVVRALVYAGAVIGTFVEVLTVGERVDVLIIASNMVVGLLMDGVTCGVRTNFDVDVLVNVNVKLFAGVISP